MSQARTDQQDPRIVVFATAERLGAVAPACALAAAVVVTGDVDGLDTDAVDTVRAAGCPATGFDGLHLEADDAEALKAARRALAAGASLGAGSAATRHEAMALGEGLPDYVLFGRIGAGERPDRAADMELIVWWSDLFEVASVAVAATPDEAADLIAAGADFVAVHDLLWRAGDPAEALRVLAASLPDPRPQAVEAVG